MKNQIDAYASAEILEEYTETVEYIKEKVAEFLEILRNNID